MSVQHSIGETLEIIDYSPEIDTYLKVICFPTFPGHCGCILFDIARIRFTRNSSDAEKALMLYFGRHPGVNRKIDQCPRIIQNRMQTRALLRQEKYAVDLHPFWVDSHHNS